MNAVSVDCKCVGEEVMVVTLSGLSEGYRIPQAARESVCPVLQGRDQFRRYRVFKVRDTVVEQQARFAVGGEVQGTDGGIEEL